MVYIRKGKGLRLLSSRSEFCNFNKAVGIWLSDIWPIGVGFPNWINHRWTFNRRDSQLFICLYSPNKWVLCQNEHMARPNNNIQSWQGDFDLKGRRQWNHFFLFGRLGWRLARLKDFVSDWKFWKEHGCILRLQVNNVWKLHIFVVLPLACEANSCRHPLSRGISNFCQVSVPCFLHVRAAQLSLLLI